MPKAGNWLERQEVIITTGENDSEGYRARSLGTRGRLIIVSIPQFGTKFLWPKKGTRLYLRFTPSTNTARINAEVVARQLKPVPLLVLSALEDVPLTQVGVIRRTSKVIAVTSGKGGTGKTFFAINLALALAKHSRKVVLVDGDIGAANVTVHLGLKPERDITEVIQGKANVRDVMIQGPGGLLIVPGATASPEHADLTRWQLGRLISGLVELESDLDFIVVDTGAGVSPVVGTLLLTSDEAIVVTNDDPAAIIDAYGVIKLIDSQQHKPVVRLVLNRVEFPGKAWRRARNLQGVVSRLLGIELDILGVIANDSLVPESLERQLPCMLLFPMSSTSRLIAEMAEKLV